MPPISDTEVVEWLESHTAYRLDHHGGVHYPTTQGPHWRLRFGEKSARNQFKTLREAVTFFHTNPVETLERASLHPGP